MNKIKEFREKFAFDVDGKRNWMIIRETEWLQKALKEEREEVLKEIDPFDLVVDCKPDCTPEEHAYHQGTWDSFQKLEKTLATLSKEGRNK